MRLSSTQTSPLGTLKYAILPVVVIGSVVLLGTFFFLNGRAIMADELKDRLRATAALASLHIDPALFQSLHTFSDTTKPQYRMLVTELDTIRKNIPNIRFAYIMRPTSDPITMEFIADADGLKNPQQLDVNKNGTVDTDEEPGHPGDPYDIRDVPALQNISEPSVDPDFTTDQWGTFISGYAPILNANGKVVGVLGLDMDAKDFSHITQQIFSPVAFLLVAIGGMIMATYVLFVVRQRRMEALQQLNNDRAALMDLATHQLGVPLATFRWWVEILRDQAKKTNADAITQLEEGIARMDHIIASLRSAAHMQDRQADYHPVRVNLKKILTFVPESTFTLVKRRKQKMITSIPANIFITIDPKIFSGVIQELIENASYYSADKKTITLRARMDHRKVIIELIDQGYGINPKDLPHIFEQFSRGQNATLYKPAGNGLGLFIAKGIIENAKGKITVESVVNKGTTFTITLPAS